MSQSKPQKVITKKKSAKPRRWTIERIIMQIEENGGPQGLDLSGQELQHIDWGAEAVAHQLKLRGYEPGDEIPVWVSPFSSRGERGLNLEKVNFEGASLRFANLSGADMTWCNLRNTDFRDARLQSVNFYQSDFYHSRLWRADLRRAIFSSAKLTHASFYRAEFDDTDFLDADLTDTLLHGADLSKIIVKRRSFPPHLVIENYKRYADLVKWDDPSISTAEWDREVVHYLERARDAYRGLKTSFINNGMYYDAGWAYFRERVVERRMHGWGQIMLYFGSQIQGRRFYPLQFLKLYILHSMLWLEFWLEEVTCGYGDKPRRTFGFAAAVILGFAPLYWLSAGIMDRSGHSLGWLDYVIYSMSSFATINLARFDVINIFAELLTSLEALSGIAVLALLMFTLGNRISRS
jgi:uncharacterized protein YjbI with pentapeptide repeats